MNVQFGPVHLFVFTNIIIRKNIWVLCASRAHFDISLEASWQQQQKFHCRISATGAEVKIIHLDTLHTKLIPNTSSLVRKQRTCGFRKKAGHDRRNCPKRLWEDLSNPENLVASSTRKSSGGLGD